MIAASSNACEMSNPVSPRYNLYLASSLLSFNPILGSVAAKQVLTTRASDNQKKASL